MINSLKALPALKKMIDHGRRLGNFVRTDPVETVNPIVRVHPATVERSHWLYSGIEGFRKVEPKLLLDFLAKQFVMVHNFQARVRWERHSVTMSNGRNTLHKLSGSPFRVDIMGEVLI